MAGNRLVNISIIFIALSILVLALKTFQTFLRPFTVAIILTLLVMPIIRKGNEKSIPTGVSMTGVFLVLFICLFLLGLLMGSQGASIAGDLSSTQGNIQKSITSLNKWVSRFNIGDEEFQLEDLVKVENLNKIVGSVVSQGVQAAGSVFSELILVILFMLFLIPSHKMTIKSIEKSLGKEQRKKFELTMLDIEKSIRDYLLTKTIISLGTGIATGIVLYFFNSDFVFVLALLTFVLNYIPNIGSFVAEVLAILAYLMKFGFVLEVLWLILLLLGVQTLFGSILEPKFTGIKLNLSPIIILLSLFFWYWVWGVVGMLISVPLTSIIKIVLQNIKSTEKAAKFMS